MTDIRFSVPMRSTGSGFQIKNRLGFFPTPQFHTKQCAQESEQIISGEIKTKGVEQTNIENDS